MLEIHEEGRGKKKEKEREKEYLRYRETTL